MHSIPKAAKILQYPSNSPRKKICTFYKSIAYKKKNYSSQPNTSNMKKFLLAALTVFAGMIAFPQTSLRYHETFALYMPGHGYIQYANREYGINLTWSNTPVYEWKFVNGSSSGPIAANSVLGLYNLTANDFVIYAEREYGINLRWLKDTRLANSSDWLVEGSFPCARLNNITQRNNTGKSYLTYGEREYGINLVWNTRPASCNFQIEKSPVLVDNRSSLPVATAQDIDLFNKALKQLDVVGSGFYGDQFIGMTAAERSGFIANHTDTWFPIDGYKRTVCGTLTNYFAYDGSVFTDNDDDLNLNLVPTADFKPMLDLATVVGNRRAGKTVTYEHIQAEIDVNDDAYKNFFYPGKPYAPKLNQLACTYGPFISDAGHDHKPEIHTAEQIWWREGNVYFLSFMCDVSRRFDGLLDGEAANQYTVSQIHNTGDDYDTDNGRHTFGGPWAPRPLLGVYAIAFKVKLGSPTVNFNIEKMAGSNYFPVAAQPANAHYLVYQNDTIAHVTESDNLDMNVSFEKLTMTEGSFVQGYMVVRVNTGKDFTGYANNARTDSGGQLLVRVTKTVAKRPFIKPPIRRDLPTLRQ